MSEGVTRFPKTQQRHERLPEGRVHAVLDVPLSRPRESSDVRATAEFAGLVDGLWKILRKLQ